MSTLAVISAPPAEPVDLRLAELRRMVLNSVVSEHSKRNYAKALDDLFLFAASRPLTRALLIEWRTSMNKLSPSTINVRLSAMRKLVTEARGNGMLGAEDAANLTGVPNVAEKGTRLGNWLTREQAKELLAVPDRSTIKGKRDYAILALLVGCALRRQELAELDIEKIQMREGRWVIADLRGKGGRIRTVAIPVWVKNAIDAWMTAGGIDKGRLLRSISKSGKLNRDSLSDWAVWSIVEQSAKHIGIEHLRRPRFKAYVREALPQGRWRPRAGQVPARALLDSDDGAVSGFPAGDRRCRERQPGTVVEAEDCFAVFPIPFKTLGKEPQSGVSKTCEMSF